MASIDMSLDALWQYSPTPYAQNDHKSFWEETLKPKGERQLNIKLVGTDDNFKGLTSWRLTFKAVDGVVVSGWVLKPAHGDGHPGVVVYHGYGGRGARPLEMLPLASQGVAVLSIDCRGQLGDTAESLQASAGQVPGWLTRGIEDPRGYYYRYVYADAVRAVEALAALDGVDAARIAVTGASQGGGMALAAAALSRVPRFVWSDVPFLCDFQRAVQLVESLPYSEISAYLRSRPGMAKTVFGTLAYFDVLNLAQWISCRSVVTVSLWDDICPPSTVFGVFHQIGNPNKELHIQQYHRHELGYEIEEARLRRLLRELDVV
jgi:cephalosporin-C deacetylase